VRRGWRWGGKEGACHHPPFQICTGPPPLYGSLFPGARAEVVAPGDGPRLPARLPEVLLPRNLRVGPPAGREGGGLGPWAPMEGPRTLGPSRPLTLSLYPTRRGLKKEKETRLKKSIGGPCHIWYALGDVAIVSLQMGGAAGTHVDRSVGWKRPQVPPTQHKCEKAHITKCESVVNVF